MNPTTRSLNTQPTQSRATTAGRFIQRSMAMDEHAWQRHANPWSGWTRVAILPALTIALWSRVWIGWWSAIPVAFLVVWIWINPRIFPPPKTHQAWISRGVQGERIWLANRPGTIADHHRPVIRRTLLIGTAGTLLWLIGLSLLNLTATLTGLTASLLGKLWFVDRMVWIEREISSPGESF